MSRLIDDGGPAFPCDLTMYDQEVVNEFQGMTLRDHFAGQAMQGMFTSEDDSFMYTSKNFDYRAKQSYEMADAMLKARDA